MIVLDASINMHQATHVGTNQVFGTGIFGMLGFLLAHGNADGFELYGKSTAKPTAGSSLIHFN